MKLLPMILAGMSLAALAPSAHAVGIPENNDGFVSSVKLLNDPAYFRTEYAGVQQGEPKAFGAGHTVWFNRTMGLSGRALLVGAPATADVWTGPVIGLLKPVPVTRKANGDITWPILAGTRYEIRVDDAGKPLTGNVKVTQDGAAPITSIAGPDVIGPKIGLKVSADESDATFECTVDGQPVDCAGLSTLVGLSGGKHQVWARATDRHGNVDATPAVKVVTVDLEAPDTQITKGLPEMGTPLGGSASIGFAASEPGASFECQRADGPWQSCTSGWSVYGPELGQEIALRVRATDALGNTDATPAEIHWARVAPKPATPPVGVPVGSTPTCEGKLAIPRWVRRSTLRRGLAVDVTGGPVACTGMVVVRAGKRVIARRSVTLPAGRWSTVRLRVAARYRRPGTLTVSAVTARGGFGLGKVRVR